MISEKEQAREALFKKATGYKTEEVVEEYSQADGEMSLIKKKVTLKTVAPDCSAIKMIMDEQSDYSALSDEELACEKKRLLKLLKEKNNDVE